jgi:hypothetical protein
MNGIQLLLLAGVSFIGCYFITRLKNRLVDIVLLTALVLCAVIFILWPELTNQLAAMLGVGRGADLIVYISILTFWFAILKLYRRIRVLEQLFTEIVRQQALHHPEQLSSGTSCDYSNDAAGEEKSE